MVLDDMHVLKLPLKDLLLIWIQLSDYAIVLAEQAAVCHHVVSCRWVQALLNS